MNNNYNLKDIEQLILQSINLPQEYKSNPYNSKEAFVSLMPPPNITGSLHIGHALVLTLQDILIRYNRMQNKDTLWQAGVDHAGIATQLVVEKQLADKGIKKEDIGPEKFIEEVLTWKDGAQNNILEQIKKIGASCDFSNIAFTFSKEFNLAVNKVFVQLYEEGLIYQDYKLVNWDTKFSTALSDLEVTNKEELGKLYYIKYRVKGKGDIVIATTRPETIFGDSAVAVNPNDERYKDFIGKKAIIPLINKEIPIIADEYSDPNKGSGAVKITPAHDFNDFEVAQRHNLPLNTILDKQGKLNKEVQLEFQGLTIKEARSKLINHLRKLNAILKIEPHLMQVPYGDRSNTVIEPLPSKQWFLNVKNMAKLAIEAVKNKEIELIPHSWENLYFEWLNNIKPWCISRQIWWGHRIPVWRSKEGKEFVAVSKEEAYKKAEQFYGKSVDLSQESDVLDTWFSSALWPFVTMGWPNLNDARLNKYYPTSVLVTGFDILFFWVARMIMMGIHFLKKPPFKKVYLHALILDEKGQKMSKTKSNVVNPIVLMEKYGTDALRFTLAAYSSNSQNIKFSEKTLESSRNFVTKILNAYRFLVHYNCVLDKEFNPNKAKVCLNKWILLKFQYFIDEVNKYLQSYQFNEVTHKIYHFIWDIYCDWYIEIIKVIFTNQEYFSIKEETSKTAMYIFNTLMLVIHPIMPFVSQYLYHKITATNELVDKVSFPNDILTHKERKNFILANRSIFPVLNLINKIRSIRADLKVPTKVLINLYISTTTSQSIFTNAEPIIKRLARIDKIFFVPEIEHKALFSEILSSEISIGLDIKDIIDVSAELSCLVKEQNKVLEEITNIDKKLNNPNFLSKAPANIVANFVKLKKELSLKLNSVSTIINKLKNC